jgi:hypothetical protein
MQGDMPTPTRLTTLFNVWTTTPAQIDSLYEVLRGVTEDLVRKRPGFVSANVHLSRDRERLVNYAQWESVETWRAMLADPACRARNERAMTLGTPEPHVYEVISVVSRAPVVIEAGTSVTIDIFETTPETQRSVCERRSIERQPGFVSATLHASVDGVRVVDYVQWEDPPDANVYDVVATVRGETWPEPTFAEA